MRAATSYRILPRSGLSLPAKAAHLDGRACIHKTPESTETSVAGPFIRCAKHARIYRRTRGLGSRFPNFIRSARNPARA